MLDKKKKEERRFSFISKQLGQGIVKSLLKELIVKVTNVHRKGAKKDIMVFASRRSGSTWIMELLYSQPGVKFCTEPLYLGRWNRYKIKLPDREDSKFISLSQREEGILKSYFNAILNDSIQVSPPWNIMEEGYSFFTNRYVVKICNGISLIEWFEKNFEVYIVYFVRHPIPNALSIINLDWKDMAGAFLNDSFFVQKYLNKEQLQFAEDIKRKGSRLEKVVLEWCLENLIPLRLIEKGKKTWLVITYEELVMSPKKVVGLMCDKFDLEDKDRMLKMVSQPSRTAVMQSAKEIEGGNKDFIIKRWKKKISNEEEKEIFEILTKFGIDAYEFGSSVPNESLINFPYHISKLRGAHE